MSTFKWFSFDWFSSKERKELLKEQINTQKLHNKLLEERLENKKIPYKKLIYNNGNVTAVMHHGVVLNKKAVDANLFETIKNAKTEEEIILLMMPPADLPKQEEQIATKEQLDAIKESTIILVKSADFRQKDGQWYLEGVNLPLVPVVMASFIELLEKGNYSENSKELLELQEKYDALKMFWRWTALNPIESSRKDLLTFVTRNHISITKNGLLELYRRVVNVGSSNKELSQFVSSQYDKVKRWKKSPKNYDVYEKDGEFTLSKIEISPSGDKLVGEYFKGNLEELYLDLPNMAENIYTDNHTKTKVIKIGHVYKEDEDKIDLDNTIECSRGIHCGGKDFMFDGFGDTGVMVLVNPLILAA